MSAQRIAFHHVVMGSMLIDGRSQRSWLWNVKGIAKQLICFQCINNITGESTFESKREVFQQLLVRNIVSWTSLIVAYVQNGLGDEALECFRQMQNEGVYPDMVAYVCILKTCGIVRSLKVAEEMHTEIKKLGLLQKDVVLGIALVDMYFKCGQLMILEHCWSIDANRNVHIPVGKQSYPHNMHGRHWNKLNSKSRI